jgi:hypothetical protein
MRRWIFIILALQFFCSMSALAYGQSRIDFSSAESNTLVISVVGEESKALQDEHLSVLDAQHDLLDDKADLPEWLSLTWHCLSQADPWDVPRALVSPDWAPPTLAGPQRPPQA